MTITRSDALQVMAIVTACHRRTAPRQDDLDVTRATADTWAELFNAHNLALTDLVAAVKNRAAGGHADAPEPAEIITVARAIRQARDADTGPTPEYEALCESKAEDAAELAEQRRIRELSPARERPNLAALVAAFANAKAVES